MGTLNATAKDYDGALSAYQSALVLREERLAASSPLLSLTRLNVARAFEWKGDFSRAIEQYRLALAVMEQNGDELHIPMTYSNFGVAQLALGRVSEAIALQRQAIALWAQRLGSGSTYVALGLNR